MSDQVSEFTEENNRIYGVLSRNSENRGEIANRVQESKEKENWLDWFKYRFWVNSRELTPHVEASLAKQFGGLTFLPANEIRTRVHAHAYLLVLICHSSSVLLNKEFHIARQVWSHPPAAELFRLWLAARGRTSWSVLPHHPKILALEIGQDEAEDIFRGEWVKRLASLGILEQIDRACHPAIAEQKILEAFDGRVEKIESDLAYVRLKDAKGQISYAEIDAQDLAASGIGYRDQFRCEIKSERGKTILEMKPIPKRQLGNEEYAEIRAYLDSAMPDSILKDAEE